MSLKLICEGYHKNPRWVVLRPLQHPESNLPRLPELDALGPGHSLFSAAAGSPTQNSTQKDVLPPLAPRMRCHSQHLPKVPVTQVAQYLPPDPPRPVEPSVLVPTRTRRLEMINQFPGPLRYGFDGGI